MDVGFTAGMETRLDDIEDGGVNWRTVIGDFYPSFESLAKSAARLCSAVWVNSANIWLAPTTPTAATSSAKPKRKSRRCAARNAAKIWW